MPKIKFYNRAPVPMEMHKVKIVQKLTLLPAEDRLTKLKEAGFNTFMLHNGDIFMDMLTDSGVNAMSDNMQAAMLRADDAYAGSETFYRMRDKLEEIFGIANLLPAHQGRACEHILAQHFVKPGNCIIMNYHFTTSKAHVTRLGGHVEELVRDEGLVPKSTLPFKGNIDLDKVNACIAKKGADNIAYMRLEAGTNLIGGQPISYENMKAATDIAKAHGIPTILDASLLQDNLYFIKVREEGMKDKSICEITRMVADLFDIIYFSGRKFGFGRGGSIRGMERGTLSEERNPDGTEHIASVEMVRLAFPRRVFTLSQTEYVIDRVKWLYDHRHMIGGLRFVHEPKTLRFFTGRLEPVSDWPEKLLAAYKADFGEDQ